MINCLVRFICAYKVRIEQWLARGAHVPKVVGSNPTSNNGN